MLNFFCVLVMKSFVNIICGALVAHSLLAAQGAFASLDEFKVTHKVLSKNGAYEGVNQLNAPFTVKVAANHQGGTGPLQDLASSFVDYLFQKVEGKNNDRAAYFDIDNYKTPPQQKGWFTKLRGSGPNKLKEKSRFILNPRDDSRQGILEQESYDQSASLSGGGLPNFLTSQLNMVAIKNTPQDVSLSRMQQTISFPKTENVFGGLSYDQINNIGATKLELTLYELGRDSKSGEPQYGVADIKLELNDSDYPEALKPAIEQFDTEVKQEKIEAVVSDLLGNYRLTLEDEKNRGILKDDINGEVTRCVQVMTGKYRRSKNGPLCREIATGNFHPFCLGKPEKTEIFSGSMFETFVATEKSARDFCEKFVAKVADNGLRRDIGQTIEEMLQENIAFETKSEDYKASFQPQAYFMKS